MHRLKPAKHLSAEQMNMQMMHRLPAVFALIDNNAVAVLQTKAILDLRNFFKAVF